MDKRFLGILGAIIVVFIVIFAISQGSNNKNGSNSNAKPTAHIEGQGQKGVTLVEYGDYQCPICKLYYQPLKQIYAQFSKDIFFQFRNLPLSIHPNAYSAARAAEAAGLQNKYWQMHDKLYDNQVAEGQVGWNTVSDPMTYFKAFAQQVELDINKFTTDYASSAVNNAVQADIAAFLNTSYANHDINKEGTPAFFLDGKYIDNHGLVESNGLPSIAKFTAIINNEIAAKSSKQ